MNDILYIDGNKNKYTKERFETVEDCKFAAISNIDCYNCVDCVDCLNCKNCLNCESCVDCVNSDDAIYSNGMKDFKRSVRYLAAVS